MSTPPRPPDVPDEALGTSPQAERLRDSLGLDPGARLRDGCPGCECCTLDRPHVLKLDGSCPCLEYGPTLKERP